MIGSHLIPSVTEEKESLTEIEKVMFDYLREFLKHYKDIQSISSELRGVSV